MLFGKDQVFFTLQTQVPKPSVFLFFFVRFYFSPSKLQCQKPWYCIHTQGFQLCDDLRESWWRTNRKLEKKLQLPEREDCPGRRYQFIDYYKSPYILNYLKENGYSTDPPPEIKEDDKSKH